MDFANAARFIWMHARLLERRVFAYWFAGGSPESVADALRAFQNDDGGFGHALEPDVRAPESQPVFVEFGLRALYDCGIRDREIAGRACAYIASLADLDKGIPTILPSSAQYPRAGHWDHPSCVEPSFDRLTGLIGLLGWHGVRDPWLDAAVDACLRHMEAETYGDAHTILTASYLLESLSPHRNVEGLAAKLAKDLFKAGSFRLDAARGEYGLTPLDFAPAPDSYFRSFFTDRQINAHLDALAAGQQDDGGWAIRWEPPGATAAAEWRAYVTVNALRVLKAYGRL